MTQSDVLGGRNRADERGVRWGCCPGARFYGRGPWQGPGNV